MNDVMTKLQQAIAAQQMGNMAACEEAVKDVLSIDANQPDALHFMGMILWQKGQPIEGRVYIERSLNQNPNQPAAWSNLGNLLNALGEGDSAVTAYQKALNLQPQFTDALYNIAIAYNKLRRFKDALASIGKLMELGVTSAQIYVAQAVAYDGLGQLEDALAAYDTALNIDDANATALHNKGVLFRRLEQPEEALTYLNAALKVETHKPQVHYNIGNAYYDLDRVNDAVAAYKRAIAIDPLYLEAHETLNKLHFQHGNKSEYLQSFKGALALHPEAVDLVVTMTKALVLEGDAADALPYLEKAINANSQNAHLYHQYARALFSVGRIDQAFSAFSKALELDSELYLCRRDYARCLILLDRLEDAKKQIALAANTAPLDQEIIAYQALCMRLSDDPAYSRLYDFDRFVKAYDIEVPAGYATIDEFNTALVVELEKLHKTKNHPADQTLRGGTQTQDSLFSRRSPVIQAVQASISKAVQAYINEMDDDSDHPLLKRKSDRFKYSGSWSVRLRRDGFHFNHVHSEGWISSCYYVSLPSVVANSEDHQGWIKFGESNMSLGEREHIGKIVEPKAGRLVLFPSYMFHGTVPFDDDDPRITIAFDVVPEDAQ